VYVVAGVAWCGKARIGRLGAARQSAAWKGQAQQAWLGGARHRTMRLCWRVAVAK
jgi:hypothetical protein